jgi:glycosyltransferase involved in cell wall biosynthesis
MISVLVTFYNQAEYVRKCLDSILEQDFKGQLEILIGDDGSIDGTVKLIEEYVCKYPKIIRLYVRERSSAIDYEPIERATYNRLELLAIAKGDFVCFLDGDDYYYDRSFFTDAVANLDMHSCAVACAFEFLYVTNNNVITLNDSKINNGFVNKKNYIRDSFLHVGCILFRNIIVNDNINFLKTTGIFDDNIITLYFLTKGELIHISRPIYAYRQNDNGIWTSASSLQKSIITAMAYDVLMKLNPENSLYWLARYYNSMIIVFHERENIKKSLGATFYERYLRKANKYDYINLSVLLSWSNASYSAKTFIYRLIAKAYIVGFCVRLRRIFNKLHKIYNR